MVTSDQPSTESWWLNLLAKWGGLPNGSFAGGFLVKYDPSTCRVFVGHLSNRKIGPSTLQSVALRIRSEAVDFAKQPFWTTWASARWV